MRKRYLVGGINSTYTRGVKKGGESIGQLSKEIWACELCPRLRRYCKKIAREKRKAFETEDYWGKPVSGFGDPEAEIVIVGLAPGAHGANRTGRIFTGDRSGEWLYRALHRSGFANQPDSHSRSDGLMLRNAFVTCVVKCAPPDNKPTRQELLRCTKHYFERELVLLKNARIWIALGQFALQGIWPYVGSGARPKFRHGDVIGLSGGRKLILSFHPSQQNTFTGKLTEEMFDSIFEKARNL